MQGKHRRESRSVSARSPYRLEAPKPGKVYELTQGGLLLRATNQQSDMPSVNASRQGRIYLRNLTQLVLDQSIDQLVQQADGRMTVGSFLQLGG